MAATVNARWVAGYEAELPDKTILIPGETIVQIGAGEAEASDNWEVVKGPASTPREAAKAEAASQEAGS